MKTIKKTTITAESLLEPIAKIYKEYKVDLFPNPSTIVAGVPFYQDKNKPWNFHLITGELVKSVPFPQPDRYYDLGDGVKTKTASTILKETPPFHISLDETEMPNPDEITKYIKKEQKTARIKAAAKDLANSLDEADRRIRSLFIDYMRAKDNVS